MLLPPVACISCGHRIGHKFTAYYRELRNGGTAEKVLDDMDDLNRCCRIHFLTAAEQSSRMITQCYNERIHDDGCKVVETTRQEQNNIRVQRGVCRGD